MFYSTQYMIWEVDTKYEDRNAEIHGEAGGAKDL